MDFQDMFQEKFGPHTPDQIEDLNLSDDFFTFRIPKITPELKEALEKYKNLLRLSLNNIGLESLENMPDITKLQILEISNNKFDGSDLDIICKKYPNLYKLKICSNEISDIQNIYKLVDEEHDNLKKLYVEGNPFIKTNPDYKDIIFQKLETIDVIDRKSREGEEVPTSMYEEEGEEEEGEEELDEDEEDFPEGEEFDEGDFEDDEEFDEEDDEEGDEEGDEDEDSDEPPKKKKKN